MAVTLVDDLIDPEVMARMISGGIPRALRVSPFATVNSDLQGRPGTTITVPRYGYIGAAETVPENSEITSVSLSVTTEEYTVAKAAKGVTLTDEAVLSGFGDPVGQTTRQLQDSLADKIDRDALDALQEASRHFEDTAGGVLGYRPLVRAIREFQDEFNQEKVMFIAPDQANTLLLDDDFLSADKYQSGVMVRGEVGRIANTRMVVTPLIEAVAGTFTNPIVKLNQGGVDELAALTIYLKRSAVVETEREAKFRRTFISADQHYVSALTNDDRVILASFAANEPEAA